MSGTNSNDREAMSITSANVSSGSSSTDASNQPWAATEPTNGSVAAAPAISLVIPAFNEALRLPRYLESARAYLDAQFGTGYEVIVVDDGSTDQMPSIVKAIKRNWPQLTTLRHARNRGKGAAVRSGILAANGTRLLYADADGATPIEEEAKLRAALDGGADIAVGSRLITDRTVVRRSWNRALIGRAFAAVARWTIPVNVRDTQCGFKMLRCGIAKELFERVQEDGYLFDLEMLALARQMSLVVVEVPINWTDQPGSQLNLRRQLYRVPKDLWQVRRRVKRQPPRT